MASQHTKRNKQYSFIALLAVLVIGIVFSCRKTNVTVPADTGQIEVMRDGIGVQLENDSTTISPINYMVTKKCSVTCKAGSCNIDITYDIRVQDCNPSCKCGGALGLYPDCRENCKIRNLGTQVTAISDKAIPYGKTIYRHEVTANADNLKVQLELIAKYRNSAQARSQQLANQLQLIYDLFKTNNGRLIGSQVALYSAYITNAEKLAIVDK